MKTLLALFLLFPLSSFAKKPESDFNRAQTLWTNFRACESQIKNELNLINCIDGYINSKITRYEKGKLASYLAMGFSFSELFECKDVKDLLPLNPKEDEKYFCMNVLGNKSKLPGFITVTSENNKFKLNSIKYNDK
ncbi:hypothetical protein SHI21_06040 [Bacteriovorax sp. PP10]|uniref:Uncharacterized protein n=1 Tax=Bacteriovorax antarcticus TaxID=3088717 RepID=A0ABU5VRS6_9BACT|nr:hypothetical protein [Bacteriovorax sp. PP10]MEA9355749.1 hypothetical protein [Bacteriovorax sp. PP10]